MQGWGGCHPLPLRLGLGNGLDSERGPGLGCCGGPHSISAQAGSAWGAVGSRGARPLCLEIGPPRSSIWPGPEALFPSCGGMEHPTVHRGGGKSALFPARAGLLPASQPPCFCRGALAPQMCSGPRSRETLRGWGGWSPGMRRDTCTPRSPRHAQLLHTCEHQPHIRPQFPQSDAGMVRSLSCLPSLPWASLSLWLLLPVTLLFPIRSQKRT